MHQVGKKNYHLNKSYGQLNIKKSLNVVILNNKRTNIYIYIYILYT